MENPEKNTEPFIQTVKRTIITTTIIASILTFLNVLPHIANSRLAIFGMLWMAAYCILFGGHWLELFFINRIKFMLPKNILILYTLRICYWFLSAIPLFALASLVLKLFSNKAVGMGAWWLLGLIYIGIQLVMYAIMQLTMKKSFYNGVY